jgi:methyltransferase
VARIGQERESSAWRLAALSAAVAAQRLFELAVSRRHERRLRARGGRVVRERNFPSMVALHAGTLLLGPLEAALRRRPTPRKVSWPALAAFAGATVLRLWAQTTLGDAWTVHVVRFGRRRPVVSSGPYRFVRHPNYLAVIVELMALPLAGGAYVTAGAATVANALLLRARIPAEERELFTDRRYRARMSARPRLLPLRFFAGLRPRIQTSPDGRRR